MQRIEPEVRAPARGPRAIPPQGGISALGDKISGSKRLEISPIFLDAYFLISVPSLREHLPLWGSRSEGAAAFRRNAPPKGEPTVGREHSRRLC